MAPEQILGGTIDYRSDLFSIGVVSYELLSYAEAFPGESLPAITHRILSDEPVPLIQLVPDINLELVDIVERFTQEERRGTFRRCRIAPCGDRCRAPSV
jgi:serine/threonine-protein kinase